MQIINKEIEKILLNKSFDALSQNELQLVKTCFESRSEFETAQKILLSSKLLFNRDVDLSSPEIDKKAFENAFQKRMRKANAKRKSLVLRLISAAAIICLVMLLSFLYKKEHKKIDLAMLVEKDTVFVKNNLIQEDTLINQIPEIKEYQKHTVIKKKQNNKRNKTDENDMYHYDYNDITVQLLSMDFSSIINDQNKDTINSNINVIN